MTDCTETIRHHLDREMAHLQGTWQLVKQLFGQSDQRVELLNRTASSSFWVIQQALLVDLCVRLSRLTDPAWNRHQDNLTLERLLKLPCCTNNLALHKGLTKQIDDFKTLCAPLRKHRQQALAQAELAPARKPERLPVRLEHDIDNALQALAGIWTTLERRLERTATNFPRVPYPGGDGEALIRALERAEEGKNPKRV